jgi:hypothetical protein
LELDKYPIKAEGITTSDLRVLIKLVSDPHSKLSISQKSTVMRNYLFFEGLVPTDVVLSILANIRVKSEATRARILPQNIQIQLVDWLISVYSFLEEADIIERLYGLIFNYLEFEYIRPKVAHLLFLATRKKHINTLRVNRLLNIYHKYGFSEHITALVLLYQQFAPNQIFDTFPRVSQKVFLHPNPRYLQELISIRDQNKSSLQPTYDEMLYVEEFCTKLRKRKKPSAELDYTSLVTDTDQGGIPSLEKLVQMFDKVEAHSEWSSILRKDNGYRLLSYTLKETEDQHSKLNSWISLVLDTFGELEDEEVLDFLVSLQSYTEISQRVPNALITNMLMKKDLIIYESTKYFTFFFLKSLGSTNSGDLKKITEVFEHVCETASVSWISGYIDSVSAIIRSWALEISKGTTIIIPPLLAVFESTINKAPTYLRKFGYNRTLLIATIGLIKSIQDIPIKYIQIRHIVLPQSLVYPLLFIADPIAFSEICSHLNFAKSILRVAEASDEVTRLTSLHNTYVVDICNIIWRNKAFDTSKSTKNTAFSLSYEFINSLQNSLSIFDQNLSFRTLFNIHSSPAFASYSLKILKGIEERESGITVRLEGPLTQSSVQNLTDDPDTKWLNTTYENIRVDILKELGAMGYNGVSDLLFSHLRSLLNR